MAISEPAAKSGCVSITIKSRVYVWGGETKSGDTFHLGNLYIFDTRSEEWLQRPINGNHPTGYSNCTASQDSGILYLYGGQDKNKEYTGSLHSLDLDLLMWKELSSHTHDGPKKKIDCGMIIKGDIVIIFGGHLEDGGCTNELHLFNLSAGTWLSPITTGTAPPPCRAFSLVKVKANTAMLFGGDNEGTVSDQLFILDLTVMHWSKVPKKYGDVWPEERCHHEGCCIAPDTDHTQLLITAGQKGEHDTYYDDIWLLDIGSMTWKKATEENHAEDPSPAPAAEATFPELTISRLRVLKYTDRNGEKKTIRILHEIAPHWKEAGDILEIPPQQLQGIELQQRGNVVECCRSVFVHWLQQDGEYHYPPTWDSLMELLEDMKLSIIAQDIKSALLNSTIV